MRAHLPADRAVMPDGARRSRALSLLGVDQAIEVRDETSAGADPER
jgi:hypothetical protein